MNMRHLGAVLMVTALTTASAKAGIYDDCEAAIADGEMEAVEAFAEQIRGRNLIRGEVMAQAEACISAVEGTPMVRRGRTWVSLNAERAEQEAIAAAERAEQELVRARVCELRELVRQHNNTISEAEAARQDRRIEALSATVQECNEWFEQSPREALTNDICNSIFAADGLPKSTISGPSQAEVLLAEIAKQIAKQELRIVVSSGMLLNDNMARTSSTEEDDDYQCNE
jgi:hypothetical protein